MFMPSSLSKSVDQIARRAAGKDWNLYAALLEHWVEIVGKDYAAVTTPVKITFPHQPNEARRTKGSLCIRLPKGLAMEFSFKTDMIRQRINTYFGYDAIARVTFEPVYEVTVKPTKRDTPPNPQALADIKKTIGTIEEEELRQALESFGTAILKGEASKLET